jgi:hypothetical protein
VEIGDLAAQLLEPLEFGRGIHHWNISLHGAIDGAVRLLESTSVGVGCGWIGVKQCIPDVHRFQQYLRSDR